MTTATAVPLALRFAQNLPVIDYPAVFGKYDEQSQMCPNGLHHAKGTGTGTTGTVGGDTDWEDDD